jgi:putative tricarboxylic transport membrane protein
MGVEGAAMSVSSTEPAQKPTGSGRATPLGIGFGLLLLLVGAIGLIAPHLGLPLGFPVSIATAVMFAGFGFLLPAFIPLRSAQDYSAGVFIITISLVGVVGAMNLNYRTSTGVGPGMMPISTGLILIALGVILMVNGILARGPQLERWSVRGIIFVLGSALMFAWTIRPMGLIVAGPLAVVISAFADKDTKWIEVIIFSVIMTFACIALFSWGLKLPIPIWPTQTPYFPGIDTIKFNF